MISPAHSEPLGQSIHQSNAIGMLIPMTHEGIGFKDFSLLVTHDDSKKGNELSLSRIQT